MEYKDYGVCRLSIVPIRKSGSDTAEMISQLLFGEHYSVQEYSEDQKWLHIRNAFDGYEGWIDVKQHYSISPEYYQQIQDTEYKICTDLTSRILFKREVVYITLGAVLPLLNNPLFVNEEQLAFNGEAKSLHQRWSADQLVNLAKRFLNAPYLWGGKTPFGVDCSGFVQQVYRVGGYQLKRDSGEQVLQGKEVALENAVAGDLAFFTNQEDKISHVGMLIGDDQIIHASGKVRIDRLDQKGIFNLEQNRYTHTLFKIKRIIRES